MHITDAAGFLAGLLLGITIGTVAVAAYFVPMLEDIKTTNQKLNMSVKKLKEIHFKIISSVDSIK